MKPNRKAQLMTIVVMAALGCLAAWKRTATQASTAQAQPQDTIYEMFDAVRGGNLQKYLETHTGAMEASLRRAAAEIGEASLLKSLQEKNTPVKGIAILEPVRLSDREMKARVEYVFADRNEVQILYLEKTGERWKIARVEGAQRIETLIPYGTPVTDDRTNAR